MEIKINTKHTNNNIIKMKGGHEITMKMKIRTKYE